MFDTLPNLPAETTNSILISYSRDDRDTVIALYDKLQTCGFTLWRDLHNIEGGEPFWEEIKKGIDGCETVVLCMSMTALDSRFVQMEWQYARQQGKRVLPVVVDTVDFDKVPRWMGRIDWKDFRNGQPEQETVWASFIKTLNAPYDGRKVPFMADRLPEYFVQRPEEFENIVEALVDSNGAVAITAAVRGAGGFGKTTLALALCHDTRVRGAFDDGVLWVTLGENPTSADIDRYALDLCELITGDRPTVQTKEAIKTELTKAIGDRYLLLVIDDLWHKHNADIFLTDSPNSAVLITTRFDHTLPDGVGHTENVDAMKTSEAVALLTWGIENVTEDHREALEALTDRLGEWAVIVRLANATLRKRIGNRDSLDKALAWVDKALTRKGLTAFDDGDDAGRTNAVKATLEVSLDLLDDEQQSQFAQLAIFPEDAEIPFTTLEKLWDLDDFDTEDLTEALQDASLLQSYDLDKREIRLHDVIRQYLIDTHEGALQGWQAEFVENLAITPKFDLPDTYCWRNIAYHLIHADKADTLRDLLLTMDFLQAKLNHTDPNALIADCEMYLSPPDTVGIRHASSLPPTDGNDDTLDNRPIELLRHALQLSSHIITDHPTQLPVQLVARLLNHISQPAITTLLQAVQTHATPHLFPTAQTFDPASGALLRTLEGHVSVDSVTLSGRFAVSQSSSDFTWKVWDWQSGELIHTLEGHLGIVSSLSGEFAVSNSLYTLQVWNWQSGELIHTLEGHTDWIQSVSLSNDFAVSASRDNTLKVWNWTTGKPIHTLAGHTDTVWHVSLLGDFAVSASGDSTLKVWNWTTGELLHTLVGHTDTISYVSLLGDFAVSASGDSTLKVWNWTTGELLHTLVGHTDTISYVSLLGDFAVSASGDSTLKVWNWTTGELLHTLKGHRSYVKSVLLRDKFAVSASGDSTLKVWNWTTGEFLYTLEGHTSYINSVSLTDEFAVSASDDGTLKIWNWRKGESNIYRSGEKHTLKGHTGYVNFISMADEFAVSASDDGTLKIWNWATGELLRTLKGHTHPINSVSLTDEFAVSASSDETLKVWNWRSGKLIHTIEGHLFSVRSVSLSGEFAVSTSGENTLKVWNWQTGELIWTLDGHLSYIYSVSLLDEFIVSTHSDNTLKVWNWQTGELLRTLKGHLSHVNSVSLSGEFAVSGSYDNTIKVWKWKTGELIRTLEGHTSYVNSVPLAGNFAVSASSDNTIKVWNWQTGELLRTLEGHTGHINSVSLLGEVAVSGSSDHTLKVWNWQTGELITTFYADSSQYTVAIAPNFECIVSGGRSGQVHFLRPNAALMRILRGDDDT